MLIDKPIVKNDVVTIKLLSGEELLASFQEEKDGNYIVDKPVHLVQSAQADGQMGVQFLPYVMTSAGTSFGINKALVVTICPTAEPAAKMYLEQTTNIAMP
jgi:hypothetical protein